MSDSQHASGAVNVGSADSFDGFDFGACLCCVYVISKHLFSMQVSVVRMLADIGQVRLKNFMLVVLMSLR